MKASAIYVLYIETDSVSSLSHYTYIIFMAEQEVNQESIAGCKTKW